MKSLKTNAIVLRRTNYGEADRVLQIITPLGKRSVIARGVRREKSRLAGGIELFAVCEVVIAEGKGDLDILTSARLIHFYNNILSDYDRMQFGYLAVKLVSSAAEMIDGSDWYDTLLETLMGLDARSLTLEAVMTWFYLHYGALSGYELSLQFDSQGNKLSVKNRYRYDIAEKSLVVDDAGDITADHIKLLRLIATKPLSTIAQIGGIEKIIGECLIISRQHVAI